MNIVEFFLIIRGKWSELEPESEFLTSWSRSRTKMILILRQGGKIFRPQNYLKGPVFYAAEFSKDFPAMVQKGGGGCQLCKILICLLISCHSHFKQVNIKRLSETIPLDLRRLLLRTCKLRSFVST
jgi:hypothetical protein